MDSNVLVAPNPKSTRSLIRILDQDDVLRPKAALWVVDDTRQVWRLWIVPAAKIEDRRELYRRLAGLISANRRDLEDIDASDIEFVAADHPAVAALKRFIHLEGDAWVNFSRNMLNGFYLPDSIIVRMAD